ncbi:MAG: hypothetical protein JWL91_2653 [Sphingomonas bacterium]|nr:hypothetical protein [Sphingomonas bacterium]MDB5690777.1 hypothetical protein [Sphingomonas bacterium]
MHVDMFGAGHSRREVKDALNQHQKRDRTALSVLDTIFVLCILYLVRAQPRLDAMAIVVAAIAGLSGMRYFIDQSVRNFHLHRLDWDAAGPDAVGPPRN